MALLDKETHAPDFWNDQIKAQKKMRLLSGLRDTVDTWRGIEQRVADALALIEMAQEEDDDSLIGDITTETDAIETLLEELQFLDYSKPNTFSRKARLQTTQPF